MKFLIVKTSSLGDVIHAMNAVQLLRRDWPDAKIDWLVAPAFADMVACCPGIDRIILFDRKNFGSLWGCLPSSIKLLSTLRAQHYDVAIDFQGLIRSAVFAGMSGAARVVGFERPREWLAKFFYSERAAVRPGHAVDRNLELVRGLLKGPVDAAIQLPVNEDHAKRAAELLEGAPAELVAVAPGARWESKKFPAPLFAGVMEELHKLRPRTAFVLLGGASDGAVARDIVNRAPDCRIFNLVGKTPLPVSVEVIRRAATLVCNDSGPMHIAALLGKKVCAFFGPTNPARTGPYGAGHLIIQENLACIGCLKRVCPAGGDVACHRVDPAETARRINELIGFRGGPAGTTNMEKVK